MDEIDEMLLGAWRGMNKRLRMDRRLAARRHARAHHVGLLRRPVRAWCLALRSSDTRLVEDWNVLVDPAGGIACLDLHRLTLAGDVIRDLVKPVHIAHRQAMPASRAASLFGRSKEHLARWVKQGVFEVTYCSATSQSMRGKPVPVIWTRRPLDPNMKQGEPPDPIWGSAWQYLWKYVPTDMVQTLYRAPRFNTWRGQFVFRGWDWICPGRVIQTIDAQPREPRSPGALSPRDTLPDVGIPLIHEYEMPTGDQLSEILSNIHDVDTGNATIRYTGCGNRVRTIYSPVRAFGLADYLQGMDDEAEPNDLNNLNEVNDENESNTSNTGDTIDSNIQTQAGNTPAIALPRATRHRRDLTNCSFACRDCWQPVFTDGVNPHETWNLFVTHMSNGLLTGRDVPRPQGVAERGRKHVFKKSRRTNGR